MNANLQNQVEISLNTRAANFSEAEAIIFRKMIGVIIEATEDFTLKEMGIFMETVWVAFAVVNDVRQAMPDTDPAEVFSAIDELVSG